MNPSNRTIEEKLAIVQQIRSNSNNIVPVKPTDKPFKTTKYTSATQNNHTKAQPDETSPFLVFLIMRIVICVMIFGAFVYMGSRKPELYQYIYTMITTEENRNVIDFMSPFTYTLQEGDESMPETQEGTDADLSEPSGEN